jgi:hypothetical protein
MRYGNKLMHLRLSCICAVCAACCAVLCAQPGLAAPTLHIIARIAPEDGGIADAALINDEHLALLYPEAGHIADYTLDGQLYQHLFRESGMQRRFRPTACCASGDNGLAVFDEAAQQVFFFDADGNIARGIDLAYPTGTGNAATVLSAIGDLQIGAGDSLWVTLPERGVLATFRKDGQLKAQMDLAAALPYANGLYTRAQVLSDGSLFVLDYHQGAVIYRNKQEEHYHRLQLGVPDGLEAAPMVQDFAVDDQGNVLIVTNLEAKPVILLTPAADGYSLHTVDLKLPVAPARLACRYSRGRFILWTREKPYVLLLELR